MIKLIRPIDYYILYKYAAHRIGTISSGCPKTMDGHDKNISQLKFLIVHTSFNYLSF